MGTVVGHYSASVYRAIHSAFFPMLHRKGTTRLSSYVQVRSDSTFTVSGKVTKLIVCAKSDLTICDLPQANRANWA